MLESCSGEAQTRRSLLTALFGAGFGVLLARTIAPTHPVLGALGGAIAGMVYAGSTTNSSCQGTPP